METPWTEAFTALDGVTDILQPGGGDERVETTLAARERGLAYTYIAMGVLGFLGNMFVVVVIAKYKKMLKQVTNIYILNQSIIDAVCSVLLIFTYIFNNEGSKRMEGVLGDLTCRIWVTTAPLWAMMVSSSGNLIAVTIERYIAVTSPIWHKTSYTRKKALMTLPFIWVFGPLFNGVYTISPNIVKDGQCYIFAVWVSQKWRMVGGVYIFILHFALPLVVFTFCYSRMAVVLRGGNKVAPSQTANEGPGSGGVQSKFKVQAYHNVVKMLSIVVACFICCWGVNQIYFLLFNMGLGYPYIDFSSNLFHFSVFMTFVNSCVNPFIYASKYQQFQQGVKHLFGIKSNKGADGSSTTGTA